MQGPLTAQTEVGDLEHDASRSCYCTTGVATLQKILEEISILSMDGYVLFLQQGFVRGLEAVL